MATVQQPVLRSGFVTGVAWTFIVLAGLATLVSALQNIMVFVVFQQMGIQQAMDQALGDPRIPAIFGYALYYLRLIVFAIFVICVATLSSAIGLLMRKNWARIVFIAAMAFGIAWQIAGLLLTLYFFEFVPSMPDSAGEFAAQFRMMAGSVIAVSSVFTILVSALFAWIIARLVSPAVRAEFGVAAA